MKLLKSPMFAALVPVRFPVVLAKLSRLGPRMQRGVEDRPHGRSLCNLPLLLRGRGVVAELAPLFWRN